MITITSRMPTAAAVENVHAEFLSAIFADREGRHDRGADKRLQPEHDQILDLRDVIGRAGDEAGRGKAADLLHREGLHAVKQAQTQRSAEIRRDARGREGHDHARQQAAERAKQHLPAGAQDGRNRVVSGLYELGDVIHIIRNAQLQPNLNDDERQRRRSQRRLAFRHRTKQLEHKFNSFKT